ncbi:MAG: hypothetical protein H6742_08990 [Alphaproteobacteria bacterium]|nr:hypothetical protein [Alphaproteobacteria bacterium]
MSETWNSCSMCKKPIAYGALYWTCSVSTCNRARTQLLFCSPTCWDAHNADANHREAWAVESCAPRTREHAERLAARQQRKVDQIEAEEDALNEDDILIVASRLKDYIRRKSGMNTSTKALGPLSDIVRAFADQAIESAERHGRKTVLDRDVPKY